MIVKEFYRTREDGVILYRTYSDADVKIRETVTGALYDEAVEQAGHEHTYAETDIPLDDEIPMEEAMRMLMGGGEGDDDETEQGGEVEEGN